MNSNRQGVTYFVVPTSFFQSIDIFAKIFPKILRSSLSLEKNTQIYFVFSGSMVKIKVGGQSSAKKEKIW